MIYNTNLDFRMMHILDEYCQFSSGCTLSEMLFKNGKRY